MLCGNHVWRSSPAGQKRKFRPRNLLGADRSFSESAKLGRPPTFDPRDGCPDWRCRKPCSVIPRAMASHFGHSSGTSTVWDCGGPAYPSRVDSHRNHVTFAAGRGRTLRIDKPSGRQARISAWPVTACRSASSSSARHRAGLCHFADALACYSDTGNETRASA